MGSMRTLLVVSLLSLGAFGCSREIPKERTAALEARAAELTGKLPRELHGKLELTAGADAEKRVAFIFPRGWEGGGMGGYRPPASQQLGAFSSYGVSANCDGTCEAKDWAATFERVDVEPLKTAGAKIEKDEPLPGGGRIVVARDGELGFVRAGFWKQGASRYYHCTVDVDIPLEAATRVLEDACRATDVVHW